MLNIINITTESHIIYGEMFGEIIIISKAIQTQRQLLLYAHARAGEAVIAAYSHAQGCRARCCSLICRAKNKDMKLEYYGREILRGGEQECSEVEMVIDFTLA